MGENHRRPSSRLGLKNAGGEIVKVEGGHIVRSTGRKDRHSKVCTAKGARDRRVRLSAHTAIQFYDVQDRLGYDRPSKAVDWLIKKAKTAIDELAVLPAWNPTATTANATAQPEQDQGEAATVICASMMPISVELERSRYDFQHQQHFNQDPILLHHHSIPTSSEQVFFSSSSNPLGFDPTTSVTGWSEQEQPEMGQFQKMVAWNTGSDTGSGGGFIFNSPPPPRQPFLGPNPLFSQGGPLQSSNSSSVRAWMDRPIATTDHDPSLISSIGFASGGFSGFRIPARIQGEEEHDAVSNKPSSVSHH